MLVFAVYERMLISQCMTPLAGNVEIMFVTWQWVYVHVTGNECSCWLTLYLTRKVCCRTSPWRRHLSFASQYFPRVFHNLFIAPRHCIVPRYGNPLYRIWGGSSMAWRYCLLLLGLASIGFSQGKFSSSFSVDNVCDIESLHIGVNVSIKKFNQLELCLSI